MEKQDYSCIAGRNIHSTTTLETVWQYLTKWSTCLSHNPTIGLSGICRKAMETDVHTKPYTEVSIPALFVTAKTGSNPDALQGWMVKQTVV